MTQSIETQSSIPEEWLSGYLDGELSSEEREQVDAALEESETLRTKLDELRGVSELLKSLPQPSLSADFAAGLPLTPGVRRSAGLPWRFGMTAGSLVAASLVAGVLWIQSTEMQSTDQLASSMEIASLESAPLMKSADSDWLADRSGADFVADSDGLAVTRPSVANPSVAMSGSLEPSPGRTLAMNAATVGNEADSVAAGAVLTPMPVTAELPRPGDLLPLLESKGGEVTVVEWAVLDVQQAFGQLQVTLSNMGVESSQQTVQATDEDDNGELLAVFVQADETVMQAVMAQTQMLDRRSGGRMAVADPPVPAMQATPAAESESVASSFGASVQEEIEQQVATAPKESVTDTFALPSARAKGVNVEDRSLRADEGENAESEFGRTKFHAQTKAERTLGDALGAERLYYQVPMQLSESSVEKIITNNSAYQAREPKRLLIVLKQTPK